MNLCKKLLFGLALALQIVAAQAASGGIAWDKAPVKTNDQSSLQHGALLIFDEVMCGLRVALGGAQALQLGRIARQAALEAGQQLIDIAQHLLHIELRVFVLRQADGGL